MASLYAYIFVHNINRFTAAMEMLWQLLVTFLLFFKTTVSYEVKSFSLGMPNVYPDRDELYLCTAVKIVPRKSYYIVGFEPNASMNRVHHMLLFGCSKPGTNEIYWDCGEMATESGSQTLKRANPCQQGSNVVYAWARNAKKLDLPENVGFQVGADTNIAYLVLQVHYAKKLPDGVQDSSGVNLLYTDEPRSKLAGVLLLATGGTIPPRSLTLMDTECKIKENKDIHPFAFRIHTHSLGKVVSGYRVRFNDEGEDEWLLLGKGDPLHPQMFYPTFDTSVIQKEDVVAARCTMESDRDRETHVGPTNADEMCNFYLMYYVENDTPMDMKYCITEGPPYHSWNNSEYHFKHIPTIEASTL